MYKVILLLLLSYSMIFAQAKDSLSKKDYKSSEVIVLDNKFDLDKGGSMQLLNSTEDILKCNSSIELIRRANFASEAMIRGYSQGRINVTIDGMRMFSACTDKMDPITSYVEVENLKASEVSADKSDMSNGVSIGGSMNLVTKKPSFGDDFSLVLDNNYSSVSQHYNSKGKVSLSNDYLSSLVSYSIKKAGDYTAGNSTLIHNSGYRKENVKFNLQHKLGENAVQGIEYIYDHSSDVGFPALIMDTRATDMNMLSYQLDLKNLGGNILSWNTKLYYNFVSHLMDDYDRSKEEIENRDVMPGMYMPMYGETSTYGLVSKSKMSIGENILQLSADFYKMNAFADMRMKELDTKNEMYLVNLGDIDTYSGGLAAGYFTGLSASALLKLTGRIDYTSRKLKNDLAKAVTEVYWGKNYSTEMLTFSASVGLDYDLDETKQISATVSRVERAPTHLEAFGFYTYNISDNSIYIGNPKLSKEKSYSINLGFDYSPTNLKFHTNLYFDYIDDYIAGLKIDDIPVGDDFTQNFKMYGNIGGANIAGIEMGLEIPLSDEFMALAKAKYQYSRSLRFDEPLPFTPPLSGTINLNYSSGDYVGELSLDFANEQDQISKHITLEDTTPGYAILNWRNSYALSTIFTVRAGVENILDKYYYTHFSINNLPSLGRNFYLGVIVSL